MGKACKNKHIDKVNRNRRMLQFAVRSEIFRPASSSYTRLSVGGSQKSASMSGQIFE